MKIVILDGHALNPGDLSYDCLRQFGELTIYDRTDSEAEAIKRIGDSEIVLVNKVQITESLLEACPNIRLICVQATGYNVVDCAACAKRGIPVTNVPTYGTAAVAQFTMALMLELCHRVGLHNHDVHTGGWVNASCFTYWLTPQMELAGKTLGIIGFGAIGKAVGRLAKAFGMRVIAYNRSQSEEGRQIAEYVDLDTLLAQSDLISLHCPLMESTHHMINIDTINKMKDGVILVNTSRGGLIKTDDLIQGIREGKFFAVGLDVYEEENANVYEDRSDQILEHSTVARLLNFPNVMVTSHQGFFAREALQAISKTTMDNALAFMEGRKNGNEVTV